MQRPKHPTRRLESRALVPKPHKTKTKTHAIYSLGVQVLKCRVSALPPTPNTETLDTLHLSTLDRRVCVCVCVCVCACVLWIRLSAAWLARGAIR